MHCLILPWFSIQLEETPILQVFLAVVCSYIIYHDFKLKLMVFWTPIPEYLKIRHSKIEIQYNSSYNL